MSSPIRALADRTHRDTPQDVLTARTRWFLVGLILLLVIFARVRLLDVPFERDEGEYAYMGQLLLQGVPPYADAYTMKLPGTSMVYAISMYLFGQTIQGVRLGFLLLNCATIVLIYFLAKRIANDLAAVIASAAYALLSLSSSVLGFAAHATHYVVAAAVSGTLLLLRATDNKRRHLYLLAGGVFGLSLLMKQPGIFFIAFGAVYIVLCRLLSPAPRPLPKDTLLALALFLLGSALPLLVISGWLFLAGVFGKFWFWTVRYATLYGSEIPLSAAFDNFQHKLRDVVDGFYLLWIMAVLGLLLALFHQRGNAKRWFIVLFASFSFFSICPGLYFRDHYFITLLPALSVSIGLLVNHLQTVVRVVAISPWLRFAGLGIFLAAALPGFVSQKDYLLTEDPAMVSRHIFQNSPFVESLEIARFIEERSSPADKIAVFGSEPQIYFYSKRRSATGHIYTYGLMEGHAYSFAMQREMAREVDSARPKFIVLVNNNDSWLVSEASDTSLFGWLNEYLKAGYHLVGVVDRNSPDRTIYKWYDEAQNYRPLSPPDVLIFERAGELG